MPTHYKLDTLVKIALKFSGKNFFSNKRSKLQIFHNISQSHLVTFITSTLFSFNISLKDISPSKYSEKTKKNKKFLQETKLSVVIAL